MIKLAVWGIIIIIIIYDIYIAPYSARSCSKGFSAFCHWHLFLMWLFELPNDKTCCLRNNNNNNNIYIAPSSARSCSKGLYNIIYNIISPDSDQLNCIIFAAIQLFPLAIIF